MSGNRRLDTRVALITATVEDQGPAIALTFVRKSAAVMCTDAHGKSAAKVSVHPRFRSSLAYTITKGGSFQTDHILTVQPVLQRITLNSTFSESVMSAISAGTHDTLTLQEPLYRNLLRHPRRPETTLGTAHCHSSDNAAPVTTIALPVDGDYPCL